MHQHGVNAAPVGVFGEGLTIAHIDNCRGSLLEVIKPELAAAFSGKCKSCSHGQLFSPPVSRCSFSEPSGLVTLVTP